MRILEVFAEPLSYGGQEAFILNMYMNFKEQKNKYVFFTPYYCDNNKLQQEVEKRKDVIIARNKNFDSKLRKKYYIEELKKFFKEDHNFDVVHIHSGSIFALANGAKISAHNGIEKIIVHSHCTGVENLKHKIIKKLYERKLLKYPTDYFACSFDAADFKFPKKIICEKKYKVIKNGINLEKFSFDINARQEYRKNFNIEDDFVIINVGRMTEQKNQLFLIDIMNVIVNQYNNKNIKLIIIGDGPLKSFILDRVNNYRLNDNIIILSNRNDINELLSASDLFVFPSIYEGLGIVAIEAQANGLGTFCSDMVPNEANITPLFQKVDLRIGTESWSSKILEYKKNYDGRKLKNIKNLITESGYDVKECAQKLENEYDYVNGGIYDGKKWKGKV